MGDVLLKLALFFCYSCAAFLGGAQAQMTPHSREKRGRDALKAGNTLTGFKDITESQGQNLVMNVFCVPFSLDSCIAEKVDPRYFRPTEDTL